MVGLVNQDTRVPPGFTHLLIAGVIRQKGILRAGGVVQAMLNRAGMGLNVREMPFDICAGHHQAVEPDFPEIGRREVQAPPGGDIAPLDDQILLVLYGGLDNFTHNRPQIGFQFSIILRGEVRAAASDESHFQKIDG